MGTERQLGKSDQPADRGRPASTVFGVTLFAVLGVVLGMMMVAFNKFVFYTTKAFHFLEGAHIVAFLVVFVLSFASTPLSARMAGRGSLALFVVVWVCSYAMAAVAVGLSVAAIHRGGTLPDTLVPLGYLILPAAAGTLTFLFACRRRLRRGGPTEP